MCYSTSSGLPLSCGEAVLRWSSSLTLWCHFSGAIPGQTEGKNGWHRGCGSGDSVAEKYPQRPRCDQAPRDPHVPAASERYEAPLASRTSVSWRLQARVGRLKVWHGGHFWLLDFFVAPQPRFKNDTYMYYSEIVYTYIYMVHICCAKSFFVFFPTDFSGGKYIG